MKDAGMQHKFLTLKSLFFLTAFVGLVVSTVSHKADTQLSKTGRTLDFAIAGEGYFTLYDQETGYTIFTRVGSFDIDAEGSLTAWFDGKLLPLQPGLSVPEDSAGFAVSPTGRVSVILDGTRKQMGKIQLHRWPTNDSEPAEISFTNPSSGMLAASPGDLGCGFLVQGWLEKPGSLSPCLFGAWGAAVCFIAIWLAQKLVRHNVTVNHTRSSALTLKSATQYATTV